ncbi:MAG: DUF362 domain-containing protein [Ignavibacteriaceae bacterium]|nr:DUF362 domain-containing protein [Ignavibacteriaceae bacterium]
MFQLSKNNFQNRYNKLSVLTVIIAAVLTTAVMSYFTETNKMVFDPLPTWEVNNPTSQVFVMDKIPPTSGSLAAGDSTVPNAYLVDPAIDTLLLMMQTKGTYLHKTAAHPSGIVGSNDIVIIKGSFQWDFRNTTSTDRIKGLIWQILQHPEGFTGEIIVADNTQWAEMGEDDNNSEDPAQCILDAINTFHSKGYPVYLCEWKDIMYNVVNEYSDGDYVDGYPYDPASKISYPKFKSPSGNYYISLKYGIWNPTTQTYNHDRLCIVDFPVLKAHGWTGATLAIKNWIGVLTVAYQNERYGGDGPMHFDYMFSEFALPAKVMQVTFPKLTIIDAAWTNPERNYGNIAIQLKMLLGSTDPFAASWYAAKYMLTPVAYYPDRTDPDNPGGVYNECLTNWINCMHDSGFAVSKDSSKISVYDRSVLSAQSTFNLTVSISDGWNLVSVPGINPDGQGVSNWWPGRIGDVFKFNDGYQIITATTPGEGYWMKHSGARIYNTGDEWPAIQIVSHNSINATKGWNLIGGYENSFSTTALTTTPPGLIIGPIYKYSVGYQIAETLDPGYGYWVNLTGRGLINIPDDFAKGVGKAAEYIKEDWGRIIISDATGKSYTLYAVNDKVNLNIYELPPRPPAGTFDIRFGSGRIAENINQSFQIIEMTGIEHPIKLTVENINLRLQDETGIEINENLKPVDEIKIHNTSINKLIITEELTPNNFALEQNYPNPFNPSTTISYTIPASSFVTLKVYDVLGNEIATLVNEEKPGGKYEVEFSPEQTISLSSGIYFYRLQSGSFIETKKMILLR